MIKRIIYSILSVLLLLLIAGTFLVTTNTGLHFSIAILTKILPGQLEIQQAKGTLLTEIDLTNIKYNHQKNKIYLHKLQLAWKPSKLFTGRFYLAKLHITQGNITITKTKQTTTRTPNFIAKPLFNITANDVIIKNLLIQHDTKPPVRINNLQLQAEINHSDITIQQLQLDGYPYSGHLSGKIQLVKPFQANLQGQLTTNFHDYRPINIYFMLNGDLKKLMQLQLDITKPYPAKLTASLKNFLNNGAINVNGNWHSLLIPFNENSALTSKQGYFTINGTVNNYIINLNTDISGTKIPTSYIQISGSGNLNSIDLTKILINTLDGKLTGYAKITWRPNKKWQIRLLAQNINPGVKWKSWQGKINFDVQSTGNFAHSQLTSKTKIYSAQTDIKQFGTKLTNINLNADLKSNGKLDISGQALLNNGKLTMHGTSTLRNAFSPTQITITGQNILTINNDHYQIITSPNIKLAYQKPDLTISGNIYIPAARITPQDFSNTVTLPDYITIVDRKKPVAQSHILYSQLKVILGDKVYLKNNQLSGRLAGQLTINSVQNQPIIATGEINLLDGKYVAYGQNLKIETGNLLFTGASISNPILNIMASKTVRATTSYGGMAQASPLAFISSAGDFQTFKVGVRVAGSLKRPKLKLFSDPAGLSDTDILSYLMLGVPTADATEDQTKDLFKTAQLMGLSGSNITGEIQQKFGLTEFGVGQQEITDTSKSDAATTQQAAFTIGKYINPRLYLHYSIGIVDPISIVNLTYQLTKRLTIQTETSTIENGADLFYTLETN
jgi:translocation and assembly module TamB